MLVHHPFIVRTDHRALLYYHQPRVLLGCQPRWHGDLTKYKFWYEFIKGIDNHLADALSRNPSHLPDAGKDTKFNMHTLIPDEAVDPFVLITSAKIATMSLMEGTDLDLYSKVKFLQLLSKGYDRLLELACVHLVGQLQGYHKIGPILYHQGCLWVPEGTI